MAAQESSRILLLEEKVQNLSKELVQCQADKEFVWSLWKRLQVANPDLTQAVSLVVEREKQKAEAKDRKVLEILQMKDSKIQALDQKVMCQEEEIKSAVQKKVTADKEITAVKKELAVLRHKLKDKNRELRELKEQQKEKEEKQRCAMQELKEGLNTRCSNLQRRVEVLQQQTAQWEQEKDSLTSRIQVLEREIEAAKLLAEEAQSQCSHLTSQLSVKEALLAKTDGQVVKLEHELQEARNQYQQSVAHSDEQDQLIAQLQGLHQDAQRLLQRQEEAHAVETASQQKLYRELSACFEALKSSEAQLRQSHSSLTVQLCQKEQLVCQLQAQMQQTQDHLRRVTSNLPQRSRSLSPVCGGGSPRRETSQAALAERRIQDLEELLQLKTQESEELRRAHEKRHERLHPIQTNYKSVKEQLREAEKIQGQTRGQIQRAEPLQLRREDSDAIWNELAYLKQQNKNLLSEKSKLEEEVDKLRVQSAVDRTLLMELRLCLQQKDQELARRVAEDAKVKSSAGRLERSLKKMAQLEKKLRSLDKETANLRKANQELLETNDALQASLAVLQSQEVRAASQWDELKQELGATRRREAAVRQERGRMRQQLLRLRKELGVLRAARGHGSKVRVRAVLQRHTPLPKAAAPKNPSKDGWEDVSADSDSEEQYSDSLESPYPEWQTIPPAPTLPPQQNQFQRKHGGYAVPPTSGAPREDADERQADTRTHAWGGHEAIQPMRRMRKGGLHSLGLQRRILSLQQQVAALQGERTTAKKATTELQEANQQITSQVQSLTQKLQTSKQATQRLTNEVSVLEQQKALLERELERWRAPRAPEHTCSQETPSLAARNPDTEVKQLQAKLKSSCAEVAKLSSANRALKTQLEEKEKQAKELQERISHMERDVTMKRQLAEDLKARMKILQDNDKTHKGLVEDLEKRVKSLTEEAANRKTFIDSLKQRLNVAVKEKNEYDLSSRKLREDLERREQQTEVLQARLVGYERALVELEEEAQQHMRGLAEQSTGALEVLQRKLGLANKQLEQLSTVIKVLASEILKDIQDVKTQVRRSRKRRNRRRRLNSSNLSKESLVRAQSIAASILNMSQTDLEDMLDADEDTEDVQRDIKKDQDWLDQVMKILQQQENEKAPTRDPFKHIPIDILQAERRAAWWMTRLRQSAVPEEAIETAAVTQIPSSDLLVEKICAKMKEKKQLTEELASLENDISKSA